MYSVSHHACAGVCALRGSTNSMAKIAQCTLCYYAATTVAAVILGIVLVNLIWPGKGEPLGGGSGGVAACHASEAAVRPERPPYFVCCQC